MSARGGGSSSPDRTGGHGRQFRPAAGERGRVEAAACPKCGDWLEFSTDGNGHVVERCLTCERLARRGLRIAHYKVRECVRCHRGFQATGPRSEICPSCREGNGDGRHEPRLPPAGPAL